MNLYIIKSEFYPVKQVIADNEDSATKMYISKFPELVEEDLDVTEIGYIKGCADGNYLISTSFPQWSEENRIEE